MPQVQDVGLIFLSAMASAIVHEGVGKGTAEAEILGTTLLTLTLSTFIVGLLIIVVGNAALLTLLVCCNLPTETWPYMSKRYMPVQVMSLRLLKYKPGLDSIHFFSSLAVV